MKKLFIKNSLIAVLIAFALSFTAIGCALFNGNKGDNFSSYTTKGVYTAYAEDVDGSQGDKTLKELKAKVSTDGKYLLLVTAFDDTILEKDGLYYIGYKYTFNGVAIDTTQLEGVTNTATYYGAVSLNTGNGVTDYSASDIYSNDAYEGYSLIVYEIEFETSYEEQGALLENVRAFITKVVDNGEGGYNIEEEIVGDSYVDNSAYRVANGNFENGIEGWTLTNVSGAVDFAGVHDAATFWGEGYPMNNVGNYFSAYAPADSDREPSTGTLASPLFTVGGTGVITYMFGGAGNQRCYITIENAEGEVLALYRNTKFRDFTPEENAMSVEERKALIGNTVFLANFVTYKADLSAYMGQQLKVVIHDEASSGWGVVYFDELNTFYALDSQIPVNAVVAENLLANKEALNAEIALEVTEQGDYTLDSYNDYALALENAKAVVNDIAVTQGEVDGLTTALNSSRLALTVRPIEEVDGADKALRLVSSDSKVIAIADYVNVNELSSITYSVSADNAILAVSEIVDGAFTITAGEVSEITLVTVTLDVLYKENVKLTVEFTVQISNELAPVLYEEEVVKSYDIYTLENKENITIDFAENVDNSGNLALTYAVKYGEQDLVLDGTSYTFDFRTYADAPIYETFSVTVTFVANGEEGTLTYDYKLAMTDSTAFNLANGGFEDGMTGWTKVGNIGDVDTATNYWLNDPESAEGFAFGMDGAKMFSAYAPGATETSVGTLTSSTFKIGGSGYITFKIGAMRDVNYVYIDVVDADTKTIIARYYNGLWQERTNDVKSGCTLISYAAKLPDSAMGKDAFIRISDNADSGYGLFFVDSIVTYYADAPEGFNEATSAPYAVPSTIYDVFNGGFEMNGVQGWWSIGEIGVVTNANGYWGDNIAYGKDGDYLFTGVESFGADTMREGNKGTLTSSVFEIGGTGYITYMLGGAGNSLCYVQIIDAVTNEVLVRYRQQAQQDAKLIKYVADLSAYIGKTVRFQVVDNASGGWGCVSFDNLVTYYATAKPEGFLDANDILYTVANGSFETGNLNGWTMEIWEEGTHKTIGHVVDNEHSADWYINNNDRKDGNFLMTFVKSGDVENCENTRGQLVSSAFILKKDTFVSFKFGAAHKREVRIELVRLDGQVIATFYNEAPDRINTEMHSYYYQYTNETADCFFRVVDDANSSPYGCFVIDDFRVNLPSAPEGFIAAIQQ